MNYNNIICFDLETGGLNTSTAQIVQIGAVAIDGRRLEVIPNSKFDILIKPLYGEEAATAGLEELGDGAIRIHGKTHEILSKKGVSLSTALSNFKEYTASYSSGKGQWKRPIASGYNIVNYDLPILNRDLASKKITNLFHPRDVLDVLNMMFLFFENDKNVSSLSVDNLLRKHMGGSTDGAHDALGDVLLTADVMCRSLRLIRRAVGKVNFEGCLNVSSDEI